MPWGASRVSQGYDVDAITLRRAPFMTLRILLPFLAVLALLEAASGQGGRAAGGALPAFRSDRELAEYLKGLVEARQKGRKAAPGCSGAVQVAHRKGAASTPTAVVRGRVVALPNSPVTGAQVTLGPIGVGTLTSGDGSFRLVIPAESLPAARDLVLRVRRIGYSPVERTLKVRPKDSLQVDVSLCAQTLELAEVAVSGFSALARQDGSITNTQEAGVDEGGIVKLHGEHLVILRRGRLFTVAIGGDDLRPIAAVDAFGPGIDPRRTWYDELLVSGDKVVVIGFSYERGGTEIGVFDIDGTGQLRPRATYQLRSNDYYSSRNYASRLIGTKLVYYTPLYLPYGLDEPLAALPSMRQWKPQTEGGGRFERIATPQRVYRPAQWEPGDDIALHTVTECDLAAPEISCEATVVIGPSGRVFYVSSGAVYVWMTEWSRPDRRSAPRAILCRMPLDGSSPSALGVSGSPVDQFSFLESDDGYVNVLVRSDAWGDWMWSPEWAGRAGGAVDAALLRVPVQSFGDGRGVAPRSSYRRLPTETGYAFHNRFVGDYLLYGSGNGWGQLQDDGSILYVVPWKTGAVSRIALPHGTDRIEPMGSDAVVVGADQHDLHFSGIRLDGRPGVAQRYTLPNASQGELRSHGFFYRGDSTHAGVLGLPVRGPGRPGWSHLVEGSASILFLRNRDWRFEALGTLAGDGESAKDDACKASCIDWYGNARPLFIGDRIFALLGYELVEGRVSEGGLHDARRVSFAPRLAVTVSH